MTNWEWALVWIVWWITFAWILEYFSMSSEWLFVMTIMLCLDFIFWILSAKSRWEQIESKKRQHGLVKKMTRWLLPFIVVAWLKWTWMWGIDELVKVIVGMIVFSELYSIIGHIYSINYWKELPEVDAFKMLLEWITNLLKGKIDSTLSTNKEDKWTGKDLKWEEDSDEKKSELKKNLIEKNEK
jgi:hypothetical protein